MTVFVDTNVVAYQFDDRDLAKRDQARLLLGNATSRPWVSTQVLIELHNVLVRHLSYSREDAQEIIESNGYHVQPADAARASRRAVTLVFVPTLLLIAIGCVLGLRWAAS